MDRPHEFEMVVAGAFTIVGRGTVLYGVYTGDLPSLGDSLRVTRPNGVALTATCIGIEDMLRKDGGREFGVLVTGVRAEQVSGGELLLRE
jgi:hypothetical protein